MQVTAFHLDSYRAGNWTFIMTPIHPLSVQAARGEAFGFCKTALSDF
jgi:hypothetical protein